MKLEVVALTPERWSDLERLFGEKGACAGCWCMFWRLEKGERFDDVKGPRAKARFRQLVLDGAARGHLAYADGEPVGWVARGPRRDFAKLDRAPSLTCDDAERVHSVPCFFIKPGFRGRGVATALLAAAVEGARLDGAELVEGYPVKGEKLPAAFAWTGTESLFQKAGFSLAQARAKGKQRYRRALRANTSSRSPGRRSK
ncbi:MAG: GNAT family N-acetyltransferase [Myxococcota bacterium]